MSGVSLNPGEFRAPAPGKNGAAPDRDLESLDGGHPRKRAVPPDYGPATDPQDPAFRGLRLEDFHIPARDPSGGVERVSLRMQPALLAALAGIVSSGVYPVDDVAGLIRLAVSWFIDWAARAGNLAVDPGVHAQLSAVQRQAQSESLRQRLTEQFDQLRDLVAWHEQRGSPALRDRLLRGCWGELQQGRSDHPDDPWTVWMLTEFEREYRGLLEKEKAP